MKMARQIKGGSSWKQKEKGNVNSRTGLFGIVKTVLRPNCSKSVARLSPHATLKGTKDPEVTADQVRVEVAEVQLRRTQTLQ
jgi:hypothetical protein